MLHSSLLFFSQWTRASVWLIPLVLIAILMKIEERFNFEKKTFQFILTISNPLIYVLTLIILIFSNNNLINRTYNLPFLAYEKSFAIDIALKAKTTIDKDALFVQPADFNMLKFFGERSTFVDWLAFPNNQNVQQEWYHRIEKLYRTNWATRDLAKTVIQQMNDNFYHLQTADFQKLHHEDGVTHILTKKTHLLNFPKTLENEEFVIYEIKL
jgi:hypothetical protein